MRRFLFSLIVCLSAALPARAEDTFCTTSKFVDPDSGVCAPNFSCEGASHLKGNCFDVRGEIGYDVMGRLILWTHKMDRRYWLNYPASYPDIGIPNRSTEEYGRDYMPLPARVANLLDYRNVVHGDFRICRFEPYKKNAAQLICVERASLVKRMPSGCAACTIGRTPLPDTAFKNTPE
jgi:hypothetical protein